MHQHGKGGLTSKSFTSTLSPTLKASGATPRSTSSSDWCTSPVLPGSTSTSSPNLSTLSTLQPLHGQRLSEVGSSMLRAVTGAGRHLRSAGVHGRHV